MPTIDLTLKEDIEALAEEAFHRHLISGYGAGEYPDKYQIVYLGKPRHLPLQEARTFLSALVSLSKVKQGN